MTVNSKNILTVTLNPAIDKNIYIEDFKKGTDSRVSAPIQNVGGKGINVSRILNKLGVNNIAIGFIGRLNDKFILENLDREGIRNDFIKTNGLTRTSLTILDDKTKNNRITRILEPGPLVNKNNIIDFVKKYEFYLKKSQYVVISGRIIPGVSLDFYSKLIRIADRYKIKTIFDASGPEYLLGLLKTSPFMIKPNLTECEKICGYKIKQKNHLIKAMHDFHKKGIKIAAITQGSRGAVVSDGNIILQALPPKIETKSPVGCGDTFIAYFLWAVLKNKSFHECVKYAVAGGSLNAMYINPEQITTTRITRLYSKILIKRLNT
ncbi:MAG: 1-phosphofructokinase family hexose kinase [Candidatus Omnitrophica bacterium]|nr:1-phosphofructokinase family hexose kinase [Candidatus Omnitrophota bacterium]MDD5080954.1 1-phosphofructokinase family hexose kinase [Candidatus Omnitrophota bacterium]MDD5440597.1 1-phosphofructokinase family hexose kinase [Candidatus Omnitrophota bacterium]